MTRRKARHAVHLWKLNREKNWVLLTLSILVVVCVTAAFTRHVLAARHQVSVLDCPVTEVVAHHHDDACYDDQGNLVCSLPERDLHVHAESCYEGAGDGAIEGVSPQLTCNQEEVTQEHIHGPGCFHTIADVDPDDLVVLPSEGSAVSGGNVEMVAMGGGAVVSVEAPADAGIPQGSTAQVTEIARDSEAYAGCQASALDALSADGTKLARYFDITIIDPTGHEVEPQAPVQVSIELDDAPTDGTPAFAMHLGDGSDAQGLEVLHAQSKAKTTTFETKSCSVFGVVYTVDFKYGVDGKSYSLSIPGGSYVSLEHLVEALGLGKVEQAGNGGVQEETGNLDVLGESATTADVIKLNGGQLSDATKAFMADVAYVEFSNPDLAWVGKVEDATTVGALKEAHGLECHYSAELTEDQIADINAQTVEAGDWAFISLTPFTSEEMLIVTMRDGSQFAVQVSDAQNVVDTSEFNGGEANPNKFVIWAEGSDGKSYALKTDGSTAQIDPANIDALGEDYQWTIRYGWQSGGDRYVFRPYADSRKSLALNSGYHTGSALVDWETNGIALYPPYTRHRNQQDNNYTNNNPGWVLEGWDWSRLNLGYNNHTFECNPDYCSENINITKQEQLSQYEFEVRTEDIRKGGVSGTDKDGASQFEVREYDTITYATSGAKTNRYGIKAEPVSSGKYLFDYWDLGGTRLSLGAEIAAGALEIPSNGVELTAHFKKNPDYVVPDEEKEGHAIDKDALDTWLHDLYTREVPFDNDKCDKTAELYDYENRIYRVDLTAQSSIETFVGDIDLGFMLDVSSSMKFPAKLTPVQGRESVDINHINDNSTNQAWLNRSTTYYLISDKGSTATVYEIRWGTWRYNSLGATRTGWGYKDASKDDSNMNYIRNDSVWSGAETGERYPIYTDGDPGHTRSYYLESSISNTINELNSILDALTFAADSGREPKVKIAWNTYAKWIQGSQHDFVSVQGTSISPTYNYSGGTSTDLALLDAAGKRRSDERGDLYDWYPGITYSDKDGFHWEDDAVKYAILITDGAPQRNGNDVNRNLLDPAADFLKAGKDGVQGTSDDVTLMTVGLSMGDVKKGSVFLYDISDKDAEGDPLFYKADTGDELQYALLQALRQAIVPAIVQSDITDTVGEAFYPVDKATGAPLADGNVINLEGVKIADSVAQLTDEQKKAGYGTIHESANHTFTVTWGDQDVRSADQGGWHGTIYEKAKEDFLGGNTVRTNDPAAGAATVQAKSYKMQPDATPIALKDDLKNGAGHVELASPRVNVNELSIPAQNTEWTVYLGQQIDDPLEQLKEFYKSIKVYQVVTKQGSQDTDNDGFKDKATGAASGSYCYALTESSLDGRPLAVDADQQGFFYLKDLIKKITGQDDLDWSTLIALSEQDDDANTGISFVYDEYGQDCPGTITFKLKKNHDFGQHVTTQVGSAVESYTLEMLFEPSYDHIPTGLGGEDPWPYSTGRYGTADCGNAAGTEDRVYNHVVNVFAKKLEIEKIDQLGNAITTTPATFKLYREAQDGETPLGADEVPSVLPTGKSYVLADTLTTDGAGKATTSIDIAKLPNDEPYYLVETDVPDGYLPLGGALEVRAMTDEVTDAGTTPKDVWTKVPIASPPETSPTKWDPYVLSNWEQNALIVVTGEGELGGFAQLASQSAYDHNQDEGSAVVTYTIRNDAGAELPSAGGPGAVAGTVAGVGLVAIGILTLRIVRRRRTAA